MNSKYNTRKITNFYQPRFV